MMLLVLAIARGDLEQCILQHLLSLPPDIKSGHVSACYFILRAHVVKGSIRTALFLFTCLPFGLS